MANGSIWRVFKAVIMADNSVLVGDPDSRASLLVRTRKRLFVQFFVDFVVSRYI
jgi:hypothetical protein